MNEVIKGDSKNVLKELKSGSVDLVYLDPPFFTQRDHVLTDINNKSYGFSDKWRNIDDYLDLIRIVLVECRRVLKRTGSIFLHCDKNASHLLRLELDKVFGTSNFRSEIIWSYKRWSNSKKGLLNNHQNIFFYSKSEDYYFNTIYTKYSPTTNLDQILQERVRDENNKSVYKLDNLGETVIGKPKKGVPLGDVWEIPFLNPKAKERCNYPTQKPILLLNKILEIASKENDVVLDPFCGSGTTCVSAKLLNRKYIGIDKSSDAIRLTKKRLETPFMTDSNLLRKGKEEYINLDEKILGVLNSIDALPVHRNKGIDGFLKFHFNDKSIPIRVQRENETLLEASKYLLHAGGKKFDLRILIQTQPENKEVELPTELFVIQSGSLQVRNLVQLRQTFSTVSEGVALKSKKSLVKKDKRH